MNPREDFLLRLFVGLDERAIPWCVLRNFHEVFLETGSDIDLLASPADIDAMRDVCKAAAEENGFRLAQSVRFVNRSWVFWKGVERPGPEGIGCFVRLDVDTEVRWRWFHVLSAEEVLRTRRRQGNFWVPAPEHEAQIIRAQIAWKGRLELRYAARLAELCAGPGEAAAMRREIAGAAMSRLSGWLHAARYLFADATRWLRRGAAPAGVVLRIAAARAVDVEAVASLLAPLLPQEKGSVRHGAAIDRKALLKGGLAVTFHRAGDDRELSGSRLAGGWPPLFAEDVPQFADGAFAWRAPSSGVMHIAHCGSGSMAAIGQEWEAALFIVERLARAQRARREKFAPGICVVLAGLDGSGKTTFARNLAAEAARGSRFAGVRYFHWIPSLRGVELPWPAAGDLPRKTGVPAGVIARALSAARLLKNIVLSNLAMRGRVRSLVRRGRLVLIDRYVYNYWLDPASVRYSGPARWLALALPLFPKPDVLVTLEADAQTLLARKRELSAEQIEEQIERLRALPAHAHVRLELDARQPADLLAREAFERLSALAEK